MGSLIRPELTLDCSLSSKPSIRKSTGEFLAEVSRTDGVSDKLLKLNDYVNRLRDEMRKIDAFKRELPLCMFLLDDAIATIEEEIMLCKKSNPKPILEEFIPLKIKSPDVKIEAPNEKEITNSKEKMSWMSSVQLWNSDDHLNHIHTANNKKRKEEVINRDGLFRSGKNRTSGRAFAPCNNFPVIGKESDDEMPGVTSLSLRTPEIKNLKEEIYCNGLSSKSSSSKSGSVSVSNGQSNFKAEQQQAGRKQRRCWSLELHRRFVSALQQLGGAQAATPKQIRELMQVDGLTNDEVKSHLQKYRLHTRRILTGGGSGGGGLWMSQEQCLESSKPSNSQSSSPQGPLHLTTGSSRGTSITGGDDSMEDEDDEKLESHSWKTAKHLSGRERER
ncbi:hypothetical protein ACS0TY_001835 [Phlomoides rotata]